MSYQPASGCSGIERVASGKFDAIDLSQAEGEFFMLRAGIAQDIEWAEKQKIIPITRKQWRGRWKS